MEELYTDLNNTSAFRDENTLYDSSNKEFGSTRQEVRNYLEGNNAYTLHKQKRKRFSRRRFIVSCPGNTLASDVCYMDTLKDYNDGYKFIAIFMDLFSRFVIVRCLKTLRGSEMSNAFKDVLENELIYKPIHFLTDNGVEYYNNEMKKVYRDYDINHYSTFNRDIKVGTVERFIRTLKRRIYMYLTHSKQNRYIDVLENIVSTYNVSKHAGIFQNTPFDIYLLEDEDAIKEFNTKTNKYHAQKVKNVRSPYAVGTYARISSLSRTQNPFNKGYLEQNTREVFKIINLNSKHVPITYNIQDLDGKNVKGIFYHQELIPTAKPSNFRIDILKTRKNKKNNQVEYLVKYIDYRDSQPLWISKNMLKD